MIQTIPATRAAGALLNATPGLTVDGNGIALSPTMTFFSANGGANNEGRMAVNGMTVGAARSGGVSSYVYDAVGVEEVSVRVGGGLGETDTGGPIMNIIPRSGGNTFAGTAFTSLAGDWSRGDNLNDELRALGLTETPGHHPGARRQLLARRPDPARPPLVLRAVSQPRHADGGRRHHRERQRRERGPLGLDVEPGERAPGAGPQMAIGRFSGQAGRSRLNVNYEYQKRCEGTPLTRRGRGLPQPRRGLGRPRHDHAVAGGDGHGGARLLRVAVPPDPGRRGRCRSNNKLLFDANMTFFRYNPAFGFPPPDGITNLIPVTEQSAALACTNANPALRHPGCTAENAATLRWAPHANYAYRGLEQWGYAEGATNSYNAGASYVTGSHSMRVGYQQVLAASARRDHRRRRTSSPTASTRACRTR